MDSRSHAGATRRACKLRPGAASGRDGTTLHQPVFQVQPSGASVAPRDAWAVRGSCPARGRTAGARGGAARPQSCGRRAGPELCRDPGRPGTRQPHTGANHAGRHRTIAAKQV